MASVASRDGYPSLIYLDGRERARPFDPTVTPARDHQFHRWVSAGVVLDRELAHSQAFRDHVTLVRTRLDARARVHTACRIATLYSGGPARDVLAELIFMAASVTPSRMVEQMDLAWVRPIVHRPDLPPPKRYRAVLQRTLAAYQLGAWLVTRAGAGLCLVEGCSAPRATSIPVHRNHNRESQFYGLRTPIRYCAHHARDGRRRKSDENATGRVLDACVQAWPSQTARELLVWYLSRHQGTRA